MDQEGGPSQAAAEGARYTGVQDYDDYPAGQGPNPAYYDPDDVQGIVRGAGVADLRRPPEQSRRRPRSTRPGSKVPFYVANGNHDVLVRCNEDATQALETVATGCRKTLASARRGPMPRCWLRPTPAAASSRGPRSRRSTLPTTRSSGTDSGSSMPTQEEFSDGAASYYAWCPPQAPGTRFIAVDTDSEGGSSQGNIDDPQFEWLKRELDAAQLAGKLIVLFGHHPVRAMNSVVPDEAASPCTADDEHGHDVNPGCDLDPRSSEPLHVGDPEAAEELESDEQTFTELLGDPTSSCRGPCAREQDPPVRERHRERVVGDHHLGARRLPPAAAAGRADGQRRRDAVDLRHPARPRLARHRPGRAETRRASTPTSSRRSAARSPSTTPRAGRRSAAATPRATRRTATWSCCWTTHAPSSARAERRRSSARGARTGSTARGAAT